MPAEGSKHHPYLPLIRPLSSDLLDHMVQVVEELEQQSKPVEDPSSVPGPIEI